MAKQLIHVGIQYKQGVNAMLPTGEYTHLEFHPGVAKEVSDEIAKYLLEQAPDRFVVVEEKKEEVAVPAGAPPELKAEGGKRHGKDNRKKRAD